MKNLIILIALLPFGLFAQEMNKAQRFEYAQYQVNHNNSVAYTTTVQFKDDNLSSKKFSGLERSILDKKEIFHIEYLNEGKTIKIYHLSTVEQDDLKQFILPYSNNVDFEEKTVYLF